MTGQIAGYVPVNTGQVAAVVLCLLEEQGLRICSCKETDTAVVDRYRSAANVKLADVGQCKLLRTNCLA